MMSSTFKWMALGAVLGFSVATGVSCGAAAKCTPSNCAFGCCDATGVCQSGNSDSQCGQAGATCAQCVLGQSCSFGRCALGGTGGNGGSGGGGGSPGTGGGTTGGGTGGGTSDALCTRMNSATISFYAGRSVCSNGTTSISLAPNGLARCNAGIAQCSSSDRGSLGNYAGCLETGPVCTSGNENSALTNFGSCVMTLGSSISQPCSTAVFSSSTGGGGGTTTGGGTGGGATGGGGGGTTNCAALGTTYNTFMAGRTICTNGTATLNADTTLASRCASNCGSTNDQSGVQSFRICLGGTTCFSGNENAALSTFQSCASSVLSGLSTSCRGALVAAATGGGAGGGGGTGGGGGGGRVTTLLNLTIAGALNATTGYTFTVPSGATSFSLSSSGGTGDVDFFLSSTAPPDPAITTSYTDSSQNAGNVESVTVASPVPGTWYLTALGYAAYSGVSLVVTSQ